MKYSKGKTQWVTYQRTGQTTLQAKDANHQNRLAHTSPLVFFEPLTVSDNSDSKKLLSHFRGTGSLSGSLHWRWR
ncbi:hypothetical protein N9061_02340 [bacterium]|nr:hypothetical protein [Mariniblastus sp.]MDB4483962.1 hypothetical protein [bacterium]